MYTDECVCVCVCVLGLTPQMNEVRWDDEEDEDVLRPVEEHASKELLGEEEEQKTTPNSHTHITSQCKHLHSACTEWREHDSDDDHAGDHARQLPLND